MFPPSDTRRGEARLRNRSSPRAHGKLVNYIGNIDRGKGEAFHRKSLPRDTRVDAGAVRVHVVWREGVREQIALTRSCRRTRNRKRRPTFELL